MAADEPDNLVLRMLREMRAERAADVRAMADVVAMVRRSQEGVSRVLDRLDEVQVDLANFRAEVAAFRAETDRNFRRLEADVVTAEGRGYDRQADSLEFRARLAALEAAMPPSSV